MANERRDQKQERDEKPVKDQRKAKAMGAGATFGKSDRENLEHKPKKAEDPGQGGGIQGTGQKNPTPKKGPDQDE